MSNPKIVIGISVFDVISKQFMIPFEESRREWRRNRYLIDVAWDDRVPLDYSRNNIVANALRQNVDYILFLDSDVILPKDALTKLLAHNKDIVTGIYYWKYPPYYPIVMKSVDEVGYRPIFDFKEKNNPLEIDATGFGCCLVKTDVFRNIPYPWFTNDPEPRKMEGDLNFCKRAQKTGYKIYADNTILCGHWGIILDDNIRTNSRAYIGGSLKNGEQPTQLIKHLVDTYNPKSVLDVGCGPFGSIKIFKTMGIDAWGLDGDTTLLHREDASEYINRFSICDLELSSHKYPNKFDMVFSYECAEHISNVDNYIDTITENCNDILVMTHALPGQGGYHHVNEQNDDYWIDKITKEGFKYMENETKNAREIDDKYFMKSGLIFKKI